MKTSIAVFERNRSGHILALPPKVTIPPLVPRIKKLGSFFLL
jgi:hypothetical protein